MKLILSRQRSNLKKINRIVVCLTFFCAATLRAGAMPQPLPSPPHTFQSPRPGWIKQISYLTAQPDDEGWRGFTPAERDPKVKDYHVEYRYFENAQDCRIGKACKILRYDPEGRLEEDNEVVGNNLYIRTLYADGFLASYIHCRLRSQYSADTVDGFSISPMKKMVSRFSKGNGDLTVWKVTEDTFTRTWYLNGGSYLEKMYVNGVCDYVRLDNTVCPAEKDFGDIYMWKPAQEQLLTQNEDWTKAKGHQPYAILFRDLPNEKDPIKQHIRQVFQAPFGFYLVPVQKRRPEEPTLQPLYDQLAKDYLVRRSEFFANYDKLLAEAGKSTIALGLESVINNP